MENFKVIELQETRDFSKKMNATFGFVIQNIKSLGKSMVVIAGPCILVVSLLIGSFMGEFSQFTNPAIGQDPEQIKDYFLSISFWAQMLAMVIFGLLATVMSIATVNSYIKIYGEKRTNEISVQEVWDRVKVQVGMYLGTTILLAVFGVLIYVVLVIPGVLLIQGGGLGIGLFVLYFMVVFFGLMYSFVAISFTFLIRDYENKGFFEAIKRSFYLISGKWWSTFGLVFILQLTVGFAASMIMIPFYVINMTAMMHQIETGEPQAMSESAMTIAWISYTLYYMAQLLLSALPNVGIAFQYFNLVERKESKGLMQSIDSLGKTDQSGTGFTESQSGENEQY